MRGRFFIVNQYGEIIPICFQSLDKAMGLCDWGDMVYLADSLEDLENTLAAMYNNSMEENTLY